MAGVNFLYCDTSSEMSICIEELRAVRIFMVAVYVLSTGLHLLRVSFHFVLTLTL